MKLAYSTGNAIVDEVSEMNLTGNIVPLTWFKTMTGETGKPMLLAINILSDVVYWYRAKEIRDEDSGDLVKFEKRFKADLLQRSYRQIEQRFGVTKKQARSALDYLCSIGVIRKHLRNEMTVEGMPLHNNMYLELVPEKLKELTYPQIIDDVPFRAPSYVNEDTTVVPSKTEGSSFFVTTSTESTTENTNRDNNNHIYGDLDESDRMQAYEEYIKNQIEYECLIQGCGALNKGYIDELVAIIVDIVAIRRKYILIGGERISYDVVAGKLLKLNSSHIQYVLECMKKNTSKIKNIKNYILTTLYNAPNTMELYYQSEVNHDLYGGI